MRFSLITNDKSTYWDEVILSIGDLVFLACGIALVVFKPEFFIFTDSFTMLLGIILIITAVMFIPGIIYRLMTNDKTEK